MGLNTIMVFGFQYAIGNGKPEVVILAFHARCDFNGGTGLNANAVGLNAIAIACGLGEASTRECN